MNIIEYYGRVDDNGVLTIRNRKQLKEDIKSLRGKNVTVTIEKTKKNRSIEQNKWLWACMSLLSEHTGYTKEECLNILKFKFLKASKENEETGEVFEYLKGTSELTTIEFSTFMEQVIQWSAETLGVVLPYPNSQLQLNH